MKSIETSAKTVEEAIKSGLKELGLNDSSEVDIDVLDLGSPGLFGMFGRLAKVKLTVKETDPDMDFSFANITAPQSKKSQPVKTEPAKSVSEKPEAVKPETVKPEPPSVQPEKTTSVKTETAPSDQDKKMGASKPGERREQRSERPSRGRVETAELPAPIADFPPTDLAALSEQGRITYDFLSQLTGMMGVNVDIRLMEAQGIISVQMFGDTLGILIGRRGETLDALQYITSLIVNKHRDEYIRVTLDTEHYRAKREEALVRLANKTASKVQRTGIRTALEPMNPYERRILHSALQNHPHVTTHSEGEEPYRRVIITHK